MPPVPLSLSITYKPKLGQKSPSAKQVQVQGQVLGIMGIMVHMEWVITQTYTNRHAGVTGATGRALIELPGTPAPSNPPSFQRRGCQRLAGDLGARVEMGVVSRTTLVGQSPNQSPNPSSPILALA